MAILSKNVHLRSHVWSSSYFYDWKVTSLLLSSSCSSLLTVFPAPLIRYLLYLYNMAKNFLQCIPFLLFSLNNFCTWWKWILCTNSCTILLLCNNLSSTTMSCFLIFFSLHESCTYLKTNFVQQVLYKIVILHLKSLQMISHFIFFAELS